MPDKQYIQLQFFYHFHKFVDFSNPQTFNEKLQWLKIYDRNPVYVKMVDKYEVKKIVAGIIGEEYVIPTYGVWDDAYDVDFSVLPNQFVIKCTHDSGSAIVVKDKNNCDEKEIRKKLERSLSRNFYYRSREWPYKTVKPRIIAEKKLKIDNEQLMDYKIMCFNGKALCSFVCSGRDSVEGLRVTFFDRDWNKLNFTRH